MLEQHLRKLNGLSSLALVASNIMEQAHRPLSDHGVQFGIASQVRKQQQQGADSFSKVHSSDGLK